MSRCYVLVYRAMTRAGTGSSPMRNVERYHVNALVYTSSASLLYEANLSSCRVRRGRSCRAFNLPLCPVARLGRTNSVCARVCAQEEGPAEIISATICLIAGGLASRWPIGFRKCQASGAATTAIDRTCAPSHTGRILGLEEQCRGGVLDLSAATPWRSPALELLHFFAQPCLGRQAYRNTLIASCKGYAYIDAVDTNSVVPKSMCHYVRKRHQAAL